MRLVINKVFRQPTDLLHNRMLFLKVPDRDNTESLQALTIVEVQKSYVTSWGRNWVVGVTSSRRLAVSTCKDQKCR
jgi:hypothetical protein